MASSIRKCLTGFFKAVHPDMLGKVPTEAINLNTRAIQELNAYIDRLEAEESENYPTVAKDIGFFKKSVGRSGEELKVLKLCSVKLHSIPPGSDFLQKEAISVRLIRDLEAVVTYADTLFKSTPALFEEIEPIITRPGNSRKALDDLWDRETKKVQINMALYESDDLSQAKRDAFKRFVKESVTQKLTRKYSKIKNGRIRRMKLGMVKEKADAEVARKCAPEEPKVYADETDEIEEKVRVIKTGYHPDLVFFDPDLGSEDRKEGMRRLCGMNLTKDEDVWLLENVWKVMRTGSCPVPIVLGRDYSAVSSKGFVTIKYDFELNDIVDFLEEHLQQVRDTREAILRDGKLAI